MLKSSGEVFSVYFDDGWAGCLDVKERRLRRPLALAAANNALAALVASSLNINQPVLWTSRFQDFPTDNDLSFLACFYSVHSTG